MKLNPTFSWKISQWHYTCSPECISLKRLLYIFFTALNYCITCIWYVLNWMNIQYKRSHHSVIRGLREPQSSSIVTIWHLIKDPSSLFWSATPNPTCDKRHSFIRNRWYQLQWYVSMSTVADSVTAIKQVNLRQKRKIAFKNLWYLVGPYHQMNDFHQCCSSSLS